MLNFVNTRYRTLVLIACVVPFLVAAVFHWGGGRDPDSGDYAQYLLHARAILEGRSYTDIGYVYTERNPVIGPRAYSPGLPLALAAGSYLLGWNEALHTVLPFVGTLVFLLLVGLYFSNIERSALAPLVVLAVGLVPGLSRAATIIGTDLIFAALVWGVIYLVDAGNRRRPMELVALSVLGALAIMFRPAGVALIPAAIGFALMKRGKDVLPLLIPAAAWSVAFVAVNAALPVSTSYADQVAFDVTTVVRTALVNLWTYRLAVFESHLYPFRGAVVSDIYHLMTGALMMVGFVAWFPRLRRRFLLSFSVCYFLVHLVFTYTASRYLWPLFPVFTFGFLYGAQRALLLFSRRRMKEATATAVVAVTVALLSLRVLAASLATDGTVPFLLQPEVRDLMEATRSFGDGERVVFFNPRVLTLETGAEAMGLFVASPDEVVAELCDKRIGVVITGDYGTEEPGQASLVAAVSELPDAFDLTWENEAFSLYLFDTSSCRVASPHPR